MIYTTMSLINSFWSRVKLFCVCSCNVTWWHRTIKLNFRANYHYITVPFMNFSRVNLDNDVYGKKWDQSKLSYNLLFHQITFSKYLSTIDVSDDAKSLPCICPWTCQRVLCQKQTSMSGSTNYIPQRLWCVITCPWPWCLLLAQHSWY